MTMNWTAARSASASHFRSVEAIMLFRVLSSV
jgi:hypothetical protein